MSSWRETAGNGHRDAKSWRTSRAELGNRRNPALPFPHPRPVATALAVLHAGRQNLATAATSLQACGVDESIGLGRKGPSDRRGAPKPGHGWDETVRSPTGTRAARGDAPRLLVSRGSRRDAEFPTDPAREATGSWARRLGGLISL